MLPARVGRVLGVFNRGQQTQIDTFVGGYRIGFVRAALYSFEVVAGLAVAGAILLRRRRSIPVFPLLATPAAVLVTVLATYGLTRLRFAAESSLIVLAAIAIDWAIETAFSPACASEHRCLRSARAALRSL